ncbi:CDP-diacylglycerol--inositol 3-phosphatidyltransferase [Chanos chanos]|uniref:CDP-diacylglycerol--inositol 3-phosphatidyltransferase n=1 Tax=Chanos chanos TaxID=29144 RepID=A0A6J2VPH3_CHACN|nr:CDP-diacylglycerol--inositol 3-phosphatidyltransferase-like [Chanos chanos]
MGLHILMYIPNIIGYIRILLVLSAWSAFNSPEIFVPVYFISVILDGVDGWIARQLKQTSRFGAWLDVVVDNFGRSMLWNMLFDWGWLVASVEWCVFVCNHNARGAQWKSSFTESPVWSLGILVLAAGRLLCLSVEMWCIVNHVRYLTSSEDAEKND